MGVFSYLENLMSIIRKPTIQKLFDLHGSEPRVHNKHHRTAPDDAVYIGRGSPWGNPFVIGQHGTREQVIESFGNFILPGLDFTQLKGKHLVCFCKPQTCHGDLLLRAANQ